jgi:hypothetical protein
MPKASHSKLTLPQLKWTFPKSLKLDQGEWTNDTKKKRHIYSQAEAVRIVVSNVKGFAAKNKFVSALHMIYIHLNILTQHSFNWDNFLGSIVCTN